MLAPRTPQLLQALTHLGGQPQFVAVMKWLDDSRRSVLEDCASREADVPLRQAQGAAAVLLEIAEAVSTARAVLERSR